MASSEIYVTRTKDGRWTVRDSRARLARPATSKLEAVERGRSLSRKENSQLIIQNGSSGSFVDRHVSSPATAEQMRATLKRAYKSR